MIGFLLIDNLRVGCPGRDADEFWDSGVPLGFRPDGIVILGTGSEGMRSVRRTTTFRATFSSWLGVVAAGEACFFPLDKTRKRPRLFLSVDGIRSTPVEPGVGEACETEEEVGAVDT